MTHSVREMADGHPADPVLRFRLPASWSPVLLNDADTPALVASFVNRTVGTLDENATVRARMRRDLASAIDIARAGHARAMFISHELAPGLPATVTLTVYSRPELRMSPAVGTDPERVVGVLLAGFDQMQTPHRETAHRLRIAGSEIVRLHHLDERRLDEVPELPVRTLTADYWYTVPGTKRMSVVSLSTPLADIPHLMLDYFDAIVGASYWQAAAA